MNPALIRAMWGCLLLPAIAGCGATGLAWVDQPLVTETESESGSAEVSAPVRPSASPVTAAADAPTSPGENHQRLNRTVTLGEIYQTSSTPAAAGAPGNGGVTVTINNYSQGAPAYGGYGSYGAYGYTRSSAGNSRAFVSGSSSSVGAGSSSLQPGQNWPTVADHGTNYPYRSAPASPWSRAQ